MPYTPATATLTCTTAPALPSHKLAAIPAGNPNYRAWPLAKITFGISKKKQQDLSASPNPSHSSTAGGEGKGSKSDGSSKFESDRNNALKQVKDILSTSPQLSTSPRRKSAPDVYSRKPLLKVNLPPISDDLPCLLRKKSGEIVKSSLKKGKSEPTTPTFPKYVHFNTDLEQIKLFDEAQKPQAVSVDISDVESDDGFYSTSDEEEEEEEERILVINIVNIPPMTTERFSKIVFVDSVFLSNDKRKLQGHVQVQNISFEKIVNIRYSFDAWHSVSEVSATYAEKVPNRNSTNNLDLFVFTIELIDNSRNPIDGKILYFAVHYIVDGREYWDNNGGQNYQVNFKRISSKSSSVTSNNSKKSRSSFSPSWSHQRETLESCSPPSLNISKSTIKKPSRYDIGVSLHAAQSAHRPIPSSTVSPAISYDNDSYSSYLSNGYIDGMPGTTDSPISLTSSWDDSKGIDFKQLKSTPIAIPTKPTIGSTSYYDLVNQYCFYQGSPYSAASPYASSPPVMT